MTYGNFSVPLVRAEALKNDITDRCCELFSRRQKENKITKTTLTGATASMIGKTKRNTNLSKLSSRDSWKPLREFTAIDKSLVRD